MHFRSVGCQGIFLKSFGHVIRLELSVRSRFLLEPIEAWCVVAGVMQRDGAEARAEAEPISIPKPSLRTKLHHHYVMGKAREKKANKSKDVMVETCLTAAEKCIGPCSKSFRTAARHVGQTAGSTRKRHRRLRLVEAASSKLALGKRMRLRMRSSQQDVDVAFEPVAGVAHTGRIHDVDHRTVSMCRAVVARCCLDTRLDVSEQWALYCEENAPVGVWYARKCDTAKKRMKNRISLPVLGRLAANKSVGPTNVLVSKRFLYLVWPDTTVGVPVPSAVVPMESTDADCHHQGMDLCKQVERTEALVKRIMRTAGIACQLDGGDGASGVKRYTSWLENHPLPSDRGKRESVYCGNDANHLVDTFVESFLSPKPNSSIAKVSMMCSLFRTGSFFVKMLACLYPVLMDKVELFPGEAPLAAKEFGLLVMNYNVHHYNAFTRSYADAEGNEKTHQRARASYVKDWLEFLNWFNVLQPSLAGLPSGVIPHFTGKTGVVSKTDVCIAMARAAMSILFRIIPSCPEEGKWTKTPVALQ